MSNNSRGTLGVQQDSSAISRPFYRPSSDVFRLEWRTSLTTLRHLSSPIRSLLYLAKKSSNHCTTNCSRSFVLYYKSVTMSAYSNRVGRGALSDSSSRLGTCSRRRAPH